MNRCIECGYDLGGSAKGARCPECGTQSITIALTGGLADGGALNARPAARLAVAVAALLAVPLAVAILGQLLDPQPWVRAALDRALHAAHGLAILLGAYLCVLVARMLPRDSPWHRALWIVMAGRVVWGCALLAFELTSVVPYSLVAELPVQLAGDLLLAIAVARIAPSGGLSPASTAPAYIAVAAAGYGMVVARMPITVDPSGITTWVLRSGAIGAIACAVALRRIKAELTPRDESHRRAAP